jgi:hypothetical protein
MEATLSRTQSGGLPFVAQFAICCQSVPVRWTDWQGHTAPMEKDYLVRKRASASRPSGEWSDDECACRGRRGWPKFSKPMPRLRSVMDVDAGLSVTMRIVRRRKAMPRHARRPWQHSLEWAAGIAPRSLSALQKKDPAGVATRGGVSSNTCSGEYRPTEG